MNARSRLSLICALALFLAACGDHGDHGHSEAAVSGDDLRLDGSKKWVMDSHTRSMFVAMSAHLEGLDLAQAPAADLKGVGKQLRGDIDALVQGCTMTGDAHNELHKYLMDYIPAVDSLAARGDHESAKHVHGLLATYSEFFE